MHHLLRGLLHHVYMAEEGAGAAGGSAAGATEGDQGQGAALDGAGNDKGAASLQPGSGAEGGTGDKSVLAGAAGEPAQAAQVQEKYLVKNEDGSVNWEASAQKQAEGYNQLAKRMGSGDAPPKTADEYVVNVPDELKDALGDLKADPLMQDFLKDAHAAGMSQKQVDVAIGKYLAAIPQLAGGVQQLNAEDCVADLKQGWKTEAEYTAGVSNAYKAAQGFFGDDAEHIINTYGNDPKLIRGLAKMGAEMGEDKSLSPTDTLPSGTSIDELMANPAYMDPKHPEHAKVSKQVANFFAAQAKQQEKAGNAPLL